MGVYDKPRQQERYRIPKVPELNHTKRLLERVDGEVEGACLTSFRTGCTRSHPEQGAEE